MHRTGKKLLSVLLALAMVLSLLPGVALRAAADDVTYVQITSVPTAETLANMLTYDQEAALAIYNSAEFQAGAGPNGGIVLIYNVGEADGEYMVIHNAQGTPEVMSVALDIIGMMLQYGFNVYIVQPGGSVTPPDPPANPAVYYQYYTLNTADWSITPVVESTTNYTLVTSSNSNWNSGWYVVSGDVTINEMVELSGTVRLILCDGASLTVTASIWTAADNAKLIIYPGVMDSGTKAAPTIEGSGALHSNASYPSEPGIGGYETLELEIHGGVIEATGGNGAAGIGGGFGRSGCTVTIYGGSVTATGGSNGAAIGGADGANGGNVSIYGGTVNAIGGPFAVGIGAGYQGVSDGTLNFNSEGILLETSDDNLSWSVYSDGAPRGRYMRAQVQEGDPDVPAPDVHSHDDVEFEDWNDALAAEQNGEGKTASNSLPSSPGSYHLTSDVGITSTWTVPEGETELCLDGHTIRYTGSNGGVILLNNANAKLTVYDCGTTGAITGGNTTGVGGGVSLTAGTFELKNGRIEGNVASNGGGVSVAGSSASFIMSGGAVQYNCGYGSSTAGGVRMRNGSFTMTGGAIQYNVGAGFGGLSLSAGIQPKMSGTPVIKENVIFSSGLSRTNTKITKTDSGYTLAEGGTPCDVRHVTANGLKIQLLGQLESGAQIGIFNNRQSAEFTEGYKTYNPDDDPANFFFSNDSSRYIALSTGKEVLLGGYFTVTWKDEDGTVLEIDENVQTGTLPEFNGTLPEKPEDDEATYTATWLPRVVPVAGSDVTYTIAYRPTTKRHYEIKVRYNDRVNWVMNDTPLWYDTTATYILQLFTVHSATSVIHVSGDNILYLDGTNITVMEPGEETVRVYFSSSSYLITFMVKPRYTMTWVKNNGSPDDTTRVTEGVIPTHSNPIKAGNAQYSYVFAGWTSSGGDFYPVGTDLPAASVDETYTASYDESVNEYTVTWDNQGSITTEVLAYGTVPSYDGPTPVKEADESYSYSFAGWNDGTTTYGPTDTLPAVTGEVTYTAVFDATPRHVHNVVHADEIPAGCTEPGRKAYYCCDDESCELYGRFFEDEELSVEITDLTIPALGHDYAAVVTEPSCTEGGYTTYTCSRCGDSYEDNFTEALGHDFGEWSVSEEPSCTESGEEIAICARCGETETRPVDALGHNPGEPVVENYVEPTGSAEGGYDTVVYCQRCSEELSREHTTLSSVDGPNADGHFYLGGEIVPRYQFVEWEGAWYFINDYDKYARDIHLDFKPIYVEGTPFEPGCYYFDAMGRLVIQNGPQANGYFYLNGIRQKAYQLIEWNGDYYFINDGHKYARNIRLYLGQHFVEGSELAPGCYDFDDSGKLVLKNGPWEDGYFYINGIRQKAYQLIEWNGDYYFINDAHKYARNIRLYLGQQFVEGSELAPGYYDFDDSGKLVLKNGPWEDGYFYINGARQSCYQLIHWEGGYYFINDAHKYAVNTRIYLSARFIGDEPIAVGYHYFGEDGRMILD